MLRMSNFFLHLVEITLLQDIFLKDVRPVNSLKTFYIDIKTIERVKKQTLFQRKMADLKGK